MNKLQTLQTYIINDAKLDKYIDGETVLRNLNNWESVSSIWLDNISPFNVKFVTMVE